MADTDNGLRIAIKNVHPLLDGEYPLDTSFTLRDLNDIERLAHVAPMDLNKALKKGSAGIFVALAVIALRRTGKLIDEDALWDSEVGAIRLIGEESVPLEETTAPSSPVSVVEPNDKNGTSGPSSSTGSDRLAGVPSLTGQPGSDTGVTSASETLAS